MWCNLGKGGCALPPMYLACLRGVGLAQQGGAGWTAALLCLGLCAAVGATRLHGRMGQKWGMPEGMTHMDLVTCVLLGHKQEAGEKGVV